MSIKSDTIRAQGKYEVKRRNELKKGVRDFDCDIYKTERGCGCSEKERESGLNLII